MPGRFTIQKLLREAVDKNCDYFVLEVTSEGIKQYRHMFINFYIAVFTNLSLEHVESHGSFENYRNAKLKLFKKTSKVHIINGDDENSNFFEKVRAEKKIIFGKRGINAENIIEKKDGISFVVEGNNFDVPLIGRFNVYNALASIVISNFLGISFEIASRALKKINIDGRMEIISQNPLVVVDYAHTPVSLEEVYKNIKSLNKGKMICVLGSCGGGRDKWKRPIFGELAHKYCDEIIFTNEDPYDEDPNKIIEDVMVGSKGKGEKIIDRKKAIKKAIEMASGNDAVVITGKGSEPWMCVENGKKISWDDRKIAREVLENKNKF